VSDAFEDKRVSGQILEKKGVFMNKPNADLYKIWDDFLQQWPVEKVKVMTLPEYSSAGD